MLKKIISLTLMSALVSVACVAQADEPKKGFFMGGGINTVDTNSDIPEPDNYFLQLGFGFSENWSAELQYSDSYKDGSFTNEITSFSLEHGSVVDMTVNSDISIEMLSAYIAYRSSGDFYWKAKAGFMDAEINISSTGSATFEGELIRRSVSDSVSESGWAAGAGVGYSFGSSSVELEYVTTDDKIEIDSIALSYNYWF